MGVHVICRFFCTISMMVLSVQWLFWKVWTDDCSFSFFFHCVWCHWLLKIFFNRMAWNTLCHNWWNIRSRNYFCLYISWNIWSRNYFCLLYTFSGCFLVLLNWAILQRRLLYANQVCCTVCSHKSLVGFFFYFGELHATFHYTSYYSFLWLWHYVHPYFCCCSGSDAENACRNRMCLFDQPSTWGAQVRFVLNLKCVYFRCTG